MNARDIYAQARRRSRAIPCEVIRTIEFEVDSGEAFYIQTIEIVKGNRFTKGCIGIHLNNPTQYNLDCCIETAMKDNFERIYIYGKVGAK